jgi:1-acyl-sn-glycerol-3-phosphate acyltransferase
VDAVVMEVLFPRCPGLRVLYKAEMGKLPVLGTAMRVAGFVPVHRADRDRAFEAVDLAVTRLGEGLSFLLAPEGTRSTTSAMLPFKKGAFVMAIKAQVPVVPVAIIGADRAMPKGQLYVLPGEVTVRVGREVPTAGLTMDDRDALGEQVRTALAALLDVRDTTDTRRPGR